MKVVRVPWRVMFARVLVNALAVALVVLALPGVHETTGKPVVGFLVLGAIFGLINAFVKPAMQFVALPFLLGSMGLVVLLIDVISFWLLDAFTNILRVDGAAWVILAGVVLGLLSFLLDNLLGLAPPIVPDVREEAAA